MFIRSERLFLRPGWPEDWQELFTRIADEPIVRNLADAPWPYTAEAAHEFVELPQDRRYPHFLITLPTSEGSRLIGCIGLSPVDDGPGEVAVELGYWIARDQWNRGYASEAARAMLSLARTLGHRRVTASHYADNPASAGVLRKIGFRSTGEVRPRFSLGRGGSYPAEIHALTIAGRSDCDGDDIPIIHAA